MRNIDFNDSREYIRRKDYNEAFNSASYEKKRERNKRYNRRVTEKRIKKKRLKHVDDSYFGYYAVKEKRVCVGTRTVIRDKIIKPIYETYYDYKLQEEVTKLVGYDTEKTKLTFKRYEYVPLEKPYLKPFYVSGSRKHAKRMTNRKIRNNRLLDIGNQPSNYRKMYDYWWDIF